MSEIPEHKEVGILTKTQEAEARLHPRTCLKTIDISPLAIDTRECGNPVTVEPVNDVVFLYCMQHGAVDWEETK